MKNMLLTFLLCGMCFATSISSEREEFKKGGEKVSNEIFKIVIELFKEFDENFFKNVRLLALQLMHDVKINLDQVVNKKEMNKKRKRYALAVIKAYEDGDIEDFEKNIIVLQALGCYTKLDFFKETNWTNNVRLENFIDKSEFLGIALKYVLEEDLSEQDQQLLLAILQQKNNPSLVTAIGRGVKAYSANCRGTTPLHRVKTVENAEFLIRNGGRINVPTKKGGFTPVFTAAQDDKPVELFKYFANHKNVNLDHIDDDDRTLEEYMKFLASTDKYCKKGYSGWFGKSLCNPEKCDKIKKKLELLHEILEEKRALQDRLNGYDTSEY